MLTMSAIRQYKLSINVHSFDPDLWSTYYAPGTVNMAVNKIGKILAHSQLPFFSFLVT